MPRRVHTASGAGFSGRIGVFGDGLRGRQGPTLGLTGEAPGDYWFRMRLRRILSPLALTFAGLLTGNELGTLAVIHPALSRLPRHAHLLAEQNVTRRYGRVMPVLMTATFSAAAAAAGSSSGRARWLFAGAAGCYGAMMAVTLAGNVPMNSATLRLDEQAPEAELLRIRRRWYRLHVLRVALDLSGLVLAGLGVTMQSGPFAGKRTRKRGR